MVLLHNPTYKKTINHIRPNLRRRDKKKGSCTELMFFFNAKMEMICFFLHLQVYGIHGMDLNLFCRYLLFVSVPFVMFRALVFNHF